MDDGDHVTYISVSNKVVADHLRLTADEYFRQQLAFCGENQQNIKQKQLEFRTGYSLQFQSFGGVFRVERCQIQDGPCLILVDSVTSLNNSASISIQSLCANMLVD